MESIRTVLALAKEYDMDVRFSHRFTAEIVINDGDKQLKSVATFYVVKRSPQPLLERKTASSLGVLIVGLPSQRESLHKVTSIRPFPKTRGYKISLPIDKSVPPVSQRLRRLPFATLERVEEKLNELLAKDIIEPVTEPNRWVSPLVVVMKDSGDLRLCIDMRQVNKAILRETHPLPTIEDIRWKLNGATIFSRLDIKDAFHQLEIDAASRPLTTFITHRGLYRYKRLMFGISCAPEKYQKVIEQILSDCPNTVNFTDDIFVFGKSEKEHDDALQETLGKFRHHDILLNQEKCAFKMSEIDFLGHRFDKNGMTPSRSKIEAIQKFRAPATSEEEHTLAHFDPKLSTRVVADASPVGLGAVLIQFFEGQPRAVCFASKSLTDTEKRYAQTEKEALALAFSYTVVYRKGKANIADPLSRLALTTAVDEFDPDSEVYVRNVIESTAIDIDELEVASLDDPELSELREFLDKGIWNYASARLKPYHPFRNELGKVGGMIVRGSRLIIPEKLRERMLQLGHEGHLGRTKMQQRLRMTCWWPGMDEMVAKTVDKCQGCMVVSQPDRPEPMQRRKLPDAPWRDVAIDFLGPLPSGDYLLVIIDYYSRYKEVEILKKITAGETIDRLEKIFVRLGYPNTITLDNGRQFSYTDETSIVTRHFSSPPPSDFRDRDQILKEKGKEKEDRRRRAHPSAIAVGDMVLMKNVLPGNKLTTTFKPTAVEVKSRQGSRVTVQDPKANKFYDRNTSHLKQVPADAVKGPGEEPTEMETDGYEISDLVVSREAEGCEELRVAPKVIEESKQEIRERPQRAIRNLPVSKIDCQAV
ncbi:uncharacterized protein K02A2.6-like [Uranotaenia lowii]|uniref:uncharacterized protein K02A2.6-like n=1 Tax=Uranotaenia lowii TaxID=190385 RepID=UPI002479DB51|nr:uncharacterized protein K02A2.6-like [Uranotaenia lowii]